MARAAVSDRALRDELEALHVALTQANAALAVFDADAQVTVTRRALEAEVDALELRLATAHEATTAAQRETAQLRGELQLATDSLEAARRGVAALDGRSGCLAVFALVVTVTLAVWGWS